MISFITNNWTIKLGAFLIAVALWSYTNGQVRVERSLTVQITPEAILKVPENYRVTSIEPEGFTVRVSVPISLSSSLRSTISPRLVIDSDAPQRGEQRFPITIGMLELNDDIRIERINPESVSEVRVGLSLITEDYLPVDVPTLNGVPEGINASMALEPTRVRVRATRDQFQAMQARNQRVSFEPITLTDVDPAQLKTRTEKIVLVAQDSQLDVVDKVTATITLTPANTARREVAVPVQLLAPRDFHTRFTLELSQPQVVLTLHGPEQLLQSLQPETEITAYITLRSTIEPGIPMEASIGVLGPVWLTYDPVSVRVTANLVGTRPAADSAAPAGGLP